MKKNTLFVSLAMLVGMVCVLVGFSPARALAKPGAMAVNHSAPLQTQVQPFCKLTFIDHRGHSVRLKTNVCHASSKSLTFIFDSGERLTFNFKTIRPGHFVAESAQSKDPQILFYPSHSSSVVAMVGGVIISNVKPIAGSFSHLISDDEEHLTLVSGSFSL